MAKFSIRAGDGYAIQLSRLAQASDEIAKKAVYAGADIVANEVRRRLELNLQVPPKDSKHKRPKKSTGALEESLGIAPIERDVDGVINTKIGFDGYDKRGVPNQLKARAMESGTSTQPKRPFIRPAVRAVKQKAQDEMGRVVDEEIKKRME